VPSPIISKESDEDASTTGVGSGVECCPPELISTGVVIPVVVVRAETGPDPTAIRGAAEDASWCAKTVFLTEAEDGASGTHLSV
jgi:hypothetical protein